MKLMLVLYLLSLSMTASCTEVPPPYEGAQVEHSPKGHFPEFGQGVAPITLPQPDTLPEPFLKIRNRAHPRTSEFIGLEFWDERTSELIAYVDRDSLNPFARLPFPSAEQSGYFGTTEYDLREVSREVLIRTLGSWDTPEYIYDSVVTTASTMAICVNKHTAQHYAVMTFQLYLTNSRGQVIAIIDKYYVFNDRGQITAIVDNNRGGYPGAIVSQDGRWLAVKYGGEFDEDHALPEGLLFFSTVDGRLKYCDTITGIPNFTYFPIQDYLVCIEPPNLGGPNQGIYTVYFLDKQVKYSKLFDMEKIGIPQSVSEAYFNENGICYRIWDPFNRLDESEKPLRKALFEEDFEKSALQKCDQ
jgi:hypothetical protein